MGAVLRGPIACADGGALMGLPAAVRRGGRGLAWFVRGMLREDAYEKYLAHVEAEHAGGAEHAGCGPVAAGGERVMTEREFWRDVSDRQERNPQGRCC